MYYDEYSRQIYYYLQSHLPAIETALGEIKTAIQAFSDRIFPFVSIIVILLLVDKLIKRGDLI